MLSTDHASLLIIRVSNQKNLQIFTKNVIINAYTTQYLYSFQLVSVALVGFGTFFVIHHADIELVVGNESIGWFIGFILVGVATFVISLVGVVGAAAGKHRILIAVSNCKNYIIIILTTPTHYIIINLPENNVSVNVNLMV